MRLCSSVFMGNRWLSYQSWRLGELLSLVLGRRVPLPLMPWPKKKPLISSEYSSVEKHRVVAGKCEALQPGKQWLMSTGSETHLLRHRLTTSPPSPTAPPTHLYPSQTHSQHKHPDPCSCAMTNPPSIPISKPTSKPSPWSSPRNPSFLSGVPNP